MHDSTKTKKFYMGVQTTMRGYISQLYEIEPDIFPDGYPELATRKANKLSEVVRGLSDLLNIEDEISKLFK
jgi:hypothetical protein